MESLSETLKQARESKNLDLNDIAEITNVKKEYLRALEEGRFDDLPENIYARNFLRLYAQAVGLDDKEMLDRFKQERGIASPNLTPLTPISPASEETKGLISRLPAILLIVAVLGLSAWLINRFLLGPGTPSTPPIAVSTPDSNSDSDLDASTTDAGIVSSTTQPPDNSTSALSTNITGESSESENSTNSTTDNSPETNIGTPAENSTTDASTTDEQATSNSDEVSTNTAETVFVSIITNPPGAEVSLDDYSLATTTPILNAPITASESRNLIITLSGYESYQESLNLQNDLSLTIDLIPDTATETAEAAESGGIITAEEGQLAISIQEATWIEAYQSSARGEGERLVYTTLEPGDTFVFDLPVYLHVGNAGGVNVSVNGQDLGTIGSPGEVLGRAFTEETAEETPPPEETLDENSSLDTEGTSEDSE